MKIHRECFKKNTKSLPFSGCTWVCLGYNLFMKNLMMICIQPRAFLNYFEQPRTPFLGTSGQTHWTQPWEINVVFSRLGCGSLRVRRSPLKTTSDSGVNFEKYWVALRPSYRTITLSSRHPFPVDMNSCWTGKQCRMQTIILLLFSGHLSRYVIVYLDGYDISDSLFLSTSISHFRTCLGKVSTMLLPSDASKSDLSLQLTSTLTWSELIKYPKRQFWGWQEASGPLLLVLRYIGACELLLSHLPYPNISDFFGRTGCHCESVRRC